MQLNDKNIEYKKQLDKMIVEGMSDERPTEYDIFKHAVEHGYLVAGVEIWFDNTQSVWRYNGNIQKI